MQVQQQQVYSPVLFNLLLQFGNIRRLEQFGLWIELRYDLLQGGSKQRVVIRNQYR